MNIILRVTTVPSAPEIHSTYDLDAMMEALVQGKGNWVYRETRPWAESGHAKARLAMGILYQLGIGVPKDGFEAIRWYTLAAAQNDALAWKNLGMLYTFGLAGVPVNAAEARRCLTWASTLEIARNCQKPTDGQVQ